MTPPRPPDDDLAWLAFRYVADELDPDERAAFEHRLDRDQSAREAVAEAVAMLAGVVRAAPILRTATGWRPSVRRAAMAALAAAACLALAVAPRLVATRPNGRATEVGTAATTAGPAVALTWSSLRQEAAEATRPDDPAATPDDPEAGEGTPIETTVDAGDRVEGLPVWLIEAASLRPSS